MCFGGGGAKPPTPPPPPPLPAPPPPAAPPPPPAPPPQPLQQEFKKPSLAIGGTRRTDTARKRRGASAVASAPAVNAGPGGGVNV